MTKGVILKPPDIDITPASMAQMRRVGNDWVEIQQDVGEIARELKKLDKRFHISHSPSQEIYKVSLREQHITGFKEYLVTTSQSLDARLVNRIQMIMHSDYNYANELDKQDDRAEKERQYKFEAKVRENAEKLAFALRKDLGF